MSKTIRRRAGQSRKGNTSPSPCEPDISNRTEVAIKLLARLIGRQIAREQFERKRDAEQKARKRTRNGKTR